AQGRSRPHRGLVPPHLLAMAVHRTQAVVIGRRALGESDRLVDFYTRDHGKLRGVAKSARRPRSRFGSALELFTLGELVFFDTGRSDLMRVDHFDIVHPFVRVREHLERLGQGAWVLECLASLSPERDPQPPLFGLVLRSLRALEAGRPPPRGAPRLPGRPGGPPRAPAPPRPCRRVRPPP